MIDEAIIKQLATENKVSVEYVEKALKIWYELIDKNPLIVLHLIRKVKA